MSQTRQMRRKLRLYLDTSVLGGFLDLEDPKRVAVARTLMGEAKGGRVDVFLSPLVLEEIGKAPEGLRDGLTDIVAQLQPRLLSETEEVIHLAEDYLREGVIPEKFRDDARHIAITAFYGLDGLVSWNYRHMVNLSVKRAVNAVNLKQGYRPIEILSPEEVLGYGSVGI
jgi:predicted nucleic acid-binding protein